MVTKMCSLLVLWSKTHEVSILHAWECDAMTCNVVKRLASQSRVNYLYDVICQSDMLSSYGTGNITCLGHAGLSGTKKRSCRSVRVVSLLSDLLAQPSGLRERWGDSATGPGAAETAATLMGSRVGGSH